MARGKTNAGGGSVTKVGEVTLKDKSNDDSFLLCDGSNANAQNLVGILPPQLSDVERATKTHQGTIVASTFFNSMYITLTNEGRIYTSTDKTNWVVRYSDSGLSPAYNGNFVVFKGTLFVGNYKRILKSANGTSWDTAHISSYGSGSIAEGNGLIIATDSFKVVISSDGNTWQTVKNDISFSKIVYGGGLFIANSSANKTFATSIDGTEWTSKTTGMTNVQAAAYGNGVFVAISSDGYVATSIDTDVWTIRGKIFEKCYSMCYSEYYNEFLVIGNGGTVNTIKISRSGNDWVLDTNMGKPPSSNANIEPINEDSFIIPDVNNYLWSFKTKNVKLPFYFANAYIKIN